MESGMVQLESLCEWVREFRRQHPYDPITSIRSLHIEWMDQQTTVANTALKVVESWTNLPTKFPMHRDFICGSF